MADEIRGLPTDVTSNGVQFLQNGEMRTLSDKPVVVQIKNCKYKDTVGIILQDGDGNEIQMVCSEEFLLANGDEIRFDDLIEIHSVALLPNEDGSNERRYMITSATLYEFADLSPEEALAIGTICAGAGAEKRKAATELVQSPRRTRASETVAEAAAGASSEQSAPSSSSSSSSMAAAAASTVASSSSSIISSGQNETTTLLGVVEELDMTLTATPLLKHTSNGTDTITRQTKKEIKVIIPGLSSEKVRWSNDSTSAYVDSAIFIPLLLKSQDEDGKRIAKLRIDDQNLACNANTLSSFNLSLGWRIGPKSSNTVFYDVSHTVIEFHVTTQGRGVQKRLTGLEIHLQGCIHNVGVVVGDRIILNALHCERASLCVNILPKPTEFERSIAFFSQRPMAFVAFSAEHLAILRLRNDRLPDAEKASIQNWDAHPNFAKNVQPTLSSNQPAVSNGTKVRTNVNAYAADSLRTLFRGRGDAIKLLVEALKNEQHLITESFLSGSTVHTFNYISDLRALMSIVAEYFLVPNPDGSLLVASGPLQCEEGVVSLSSDDSPTLVSSLGQLDDIMKSDRRASILGLEGRLKQCLGTKTQSNQECFRNHGMGRGGSGGSGGSGDFYSPLQSFPAGMGTIAAGGGQGAFDATTFMFTPGGHGNSNHGQCYSGYGPGGGMPPFFGGGGGVGGYGMGMGMGMDFNPFAAAAAAATMQCNPFFPQNQYMHTMMNSAHGGILSATNQSSSQYAPPPSQNRPCSPTRSKQGQVMVRRKDSSEYCIIDIKDVKVDDELVVSQSIFENQNTILEAGNTVSFIRWSISNPNLLVANAALRTYHLSGRSSSSSSSSSSGVEYAAVKQCSFHYDRFIIAATPPQVGNNANASTPVETVSSTRS